jgi:hypothetical protein
MGANPKISSGWKKTRTLDLPKVAPAQPKEDWDQDMCLVCPSTSTTVFAQVPQMTPRDGPDFPAGPIHLRYGVHLGPNRGFGFQHIWAEHFAHIEDHDLAMAAVIKSIAAVLLPETDIFYAQPKPVKPGRKKQNDRATVFRLSTGLVIVELRPDTPPHYSVVTGGYNNLTQKKGSLIGALLKNS